MYKPLVSVVLVGYNAKHFLQKCLGSLMNGTFKNIEVIYIDNGSTDGTSEYIKRNHPYIRLFRNDRNVGFSPAHEGILEKIKGDAVLLLNTDTILKRNLLSELVDVLYSKKDIGAVQPKILMYPLTNKIDSIGSFLLLNGLLYHMGYEKDQNLKIYNKPMEIFSTKGAIMLIRKNVLKKVSFPPQGGYKTCIFDMDYFTAFEDTDLCHRIWLSGYRIIYVPSAVAHHIGGGTVKKLIKSFVIFNSEKNRLMTYIKNMSLPFLFKMLPLLVIMLQVESLIYLIIRRNLSCFIGVQKAFLWNIWYLKNTLNKRAYVQKKIRKVNDESFLPRLIKPVRFSYYYYLVVGLSRYKD